LKLELLTTGEVQTSQCKLKGNRRYIVGITKWQPYMFAKATGMACIGAGHGTGEAKVAREALERGLARVTKPGVPEWRVC
jgi:hypothetical protein